LHFFIKNYLSHAPKRKNLEESNLENERAREWVNLFLPNDQETPAQKGTNTVGDAAHHISGKLFPQRHNNKAVFSIIARRASPLSLGYSGGGGRTGNFVFHQSAPHIDLR